jgi:hypothetical protein
MKYKRIYGKEKSKKKFSPMDYNAGKLTGNLIYATMFYEPEWEKLNKAVEFMNEKNPDMVFEVRTFNN